MKVMKNMILKINNSVNLLEKSLDYFWAKNEVISKNIANVNTPGYKRYDVKFEDFYSKEKEKLMMSSEKKNPKFIPIGENTNSFVAPLASNSFSMRRDKNNVDINEENAELAKNTINYNVVANQLTKELSILKQAINEGRR